jgi:hypothetical protein
LHIAWRAVRIMNAGQRGKAVPNENNDSAPADTPEFNHGSPPVDCFVVWLLV